MLDRATVVAAAWSVGTDDYYPVKVVEPECTARVWHPASHRYHLVSRETGRIHGLG